MLKLEPSALEDDIYSFVMEKLRVEGNDFAAYERIEEALISALQEIVAQHKAALHFNRELLRVRGAGK